MLNKAVIIITIIQNGFHTHYHICSCKHTMKQRWSFHPYFTDEYNEAQWVAKNVNNLHQNQDLNPGFFTLNLDFFPITLD